MVKRWIRVRQKTRWSTSPLPFYTWSCLDHGMGLYRVSGGSITWGSPIALYSWMVCFMDNPTIWHFSMDEQCPKWIEMDRCLLVNCWDGYNMIYIYIYIYYSYIYILWPKHGYTCIQMADHVLCQTIKSVSFPMLDSAESLGRRKITRGMNTSDCAPGCWIPLDHQTDQPNGGFQIPKTTKFWVHLGISGYIWVHSWWPQWLAPQLPSLRALRCPAWQKKTLFMEKRCAHKLADS